jgi:hypothetical protein
MALAGGQLRAGACTAFLLLLSVRVTPENHQGTKRGKREKSERQILFTSSSLPYSSQLFSSCFHNKTCYFSLNILLFYKT